MYNFIPLFTPMPLKINNFYELFVSRNRNSAHKSRGMWMMGICGTQLSHDNGRNEIVPGRQIKKFLSGIWLEFDEKVSAFGAGERGEEVGGRSSRTKGYTRTKSGYGSKYLNDL
jgi:hypothetical protein